jgi:hypothetical protein
MKLKERKEEWEKRVEKLEKRNLVMAVTQITAVSILCCGELFLSDAYCNVAGTDELNLCIFFSFGEW